MLKYKYLVLLVLTLSTAYSFSQESKLKLAFIATPQVSWINSDNVLASRDGTKLGYSLGIQGDYFFAKNYAISTSILYSKLGGNLAYNSSFPVVIGNSSQTINEGDKLEYNLAYIEIPVGLKLKTKEFRRYTYWGQVGLSPMVNVSSTNKHKNDLSEEVSMFNFAYHFGIGTDFSLGGSTYITAALMLTNGLSDITTSSFQDKATMNTVNLRIGVIF